jgi:hypothetical protein
MGYTELRLYAEMFFDVQEFRLSLENKIRSGTVHDDAVLFSDAIARLKLTEKEMSDATIAEMNQTVAPSILVWQQTQHGIGEHTLGLLLGVIGDPYVAHPYHWVGKGKGKRVQVADESFIRKVSQLWAYCGHGDPARKPRKGVSVEEAAALGSPKAKKLVYLMAANCVKAGVRYYCADAEMFKPKGKEDADKVICGLCGEQKDDHLRKSLSDYGQLYLDSRHHYEDRVHQVACVRCGPSGKPALAGSPLSKGHQHAAALRKVGKEILRDLWIAARDGAAT